MFWAVLQREDSFQRQAIHGVRFSYFSASEKHNPRPRNISYLQMEHLHTPRGSTFLLELPPLLVTWAALFLSVLAVDVLVATPTI